MSNYNICIAGIAGSGKGLLTKEMITSSLGSGGRAFVFDSADDYSHLSKCLGGEIVKIDPAKPISINPFSSVPMGDDPASTEARADFLASFPITLATMAALKEGTSDLQQTLLSQALREVWAKKKNKAKIDDIERFLFNCKGKESRELGKNLSACLKEGNYKELLFGKSQLNLDSKIIVFDMHDLQGHQKLIDVIIQSVTINIELFLKKTESKNKTLLIFDNITKFTQSPDTTKVIERFAQISRRFYTSVVVSSYLITDFADKKYNLQGIFDISEFKIIMRQSPDTLSKMHSYPLLKNYFDKNAKLKTLKSIKSEPSKENYTEFGIWGGGLKGDINCLRVDPFTACLINPTYEERGKIESYLSKGMNTIDSINLTLKEESNAC